MDFQIEHHLEADPTEVAEVLLDTAFQESLKDLDGLAERRVLSQEVIDGEVERRTRYVLDINISGIARTFLGDADPAWVEVARWHPEPMAWRWFVEPEVASDLLEASGATELSAGTSGTARRIEGSVKVKVPLYGSRVEGWIIEGLNHAYEEEARRIQEWLERLR